jgi:hypothetical protein
MYYIMAYWIQNGYLRPYRIIMELVAPVIRHRRDFVAHHISSAPYYTRLQRIGGIVLREDEFSLGRSAGSPSYDDYSAIYDSESMGLDLLL